MCMRLRLLHALRVQDRGTLHMHVVVLVKLQQVVLSDVVPIDDGRYAQEDDVVEHRPRDPAHEEGWKPFAARKDHLDQPTERRATPHRAEKRPPLRGLRLKDVEGVEDHAAEQGHAYERIHGPVREDVQGLHAVARPPQPDGSADAAEEPRQAPHGAVSVRQERAGVDMSVQGVADVALEGLDASEPCDYGRLDQDAVAADAPASRRVDVIDGAAEAVRPPQGEVPELAALVHQRPHVYEAAVRQREDGRAHADAAGHGCDHTSHQVNVLEPPFGERL
mmetsp:Transcript_13441/g.29092  ORF Transcript_13441/g.29092 Transcript_13441/m.29092 type:complete len:278 (+) Transcript_13441:3-836(+)